MNDCATEIAFCGLGLLATWLLVGDPLQLYHLELLAVHRVYFFKTAVDLVNSDVSLVVLVDHAEDALVLLLVDREFLLHFEGRLGQ